MNRCRQPGHYHIKNVLILNVALICVLFSCRKQKGEDWPTFRYDSARSGATAGKLTLPVYLQWIYKPAHLPRPAWPVPGEENARSHLDSSYHVCIADGMVFFGSSVDNKLYALDVRSGTVRWSFFSEGPIRFAPTARKNRVYFGSDDGHVYCLESRGGKLLWKYRPGPSDRRILGNGRMISRWPIRTSVLVDGGTVYFGAGVFPNEGVYICALSAEDGSVLWKNDTMGDRSHELDFGGISPQGYLVASNERLYVPSGRAMPAAFDRRSGEFLYFCFGGKYAGGTWTLVADDTLVAGVDNRGISEKVAYDAKTGKKTEDLHAWHSGIDAVVTKDYSYVLTKKEILALDRSKFREVIDKVKGVKIIQGIFARQLWDLNYVLSQKGTKDIEKKKKLRNGLSIKINKLLEMERTYKESVEKWILPIKGLKCLAVAGDKVVGGGENLVVLIDSETGKEVWREKIESDVCGLAVAENRLFVSTTSGKIYCFGEGTGKTSEIRKTHFSTQVYSKDSLTRFYVDAANKILRETGKTKGYCLVLGCNKGRLSHELAKRSELKIIGVESTPGRGYKNWALAQGRTKLDRAGLYGSRIVLERWDLKSLPDYFADLIVSDEVLVSGNFDHTPEDLFRVLKPCGGTICLGVLEKDFSLLKPTVRQELVNRFRKAGCRISENFESGEYWLKVERGPLEGAGQWTSLFGNPQNTACSSDLLVRSPMSVLWYGEPGSENMIDRHAKSPGPVAMDGRLFIQGEEMIEAYDVYNGTKLWQRKIPGAVRPRADVDGGNLSLTRSGLYVGIFNECIRLDPATGRTIRKYKVPASGKNEEIRWGVLEFSGNLLYGTRAPALKNTYTSLYDTLVENGKWRKSEDVPVGYRGELENLKRSFSSPDKKFYNHYKRTGSLWRRMEDYPKWEIYEHSTGALTDRLMVSDMVFALDPESGDTVWKYPGQRIAHVTVTFGDGKIFFTESGVSPEEKKRALEIQEESIKRGIHIPSGKKIEFEGRDIRKLVCLDAVTGRKIWDKCLDLTECGGDAMGAAFSDGLVLFFSNMGCHHAWDHKNGSMKWKRITAISSENGEVVWSQPKNYRTRPLIIGSRVFIEPRACDLHTGEILMREHPITGHKVPLEYLRPGHACAISSASAHALFYRSFCAAIWDVTTDSGLALIGGMRPGCLINIIAASGVLLFPEASAGCTCSFPLRCTAVLKHEEKRPQPWTVFICSGPLKTVEHLAVNLGAPGDRKDRDGTVWFAYPRLKTESLLVHYPNYGIMFDLKDIVASGLGYFSQNDRGVSIKGTDKPWLYTSGCVGLRRCEIPLIDDIWGEEPGSYEVRIGFSAPETDKIGLRKFDISLQKKIVLADMDILKEAGAPSTSVVKVFKGTPVKNTLIVEFLTGNDSPNLQQAPVVNFIEIVREGEQRAEKVKKPVRILNEDMTRALVQQARTDLSRSNHAEALDKFHAVLDGAVSEDMILKALEGISAIKSRKSLSRLVRYCRDTAPILWNYREPADELKNAATGAFVAIALQTAKTDEDKAVRMLKYALTIVPEKSRNDVIKNLQKLGVAVEKRSSK